MAELYSYVLYSNEIEERFFSFMKDVKSDVCSKLKENNIEALLHIKVEGPEIEEFIKEHSSDPAVFWWDAKEHRKGGNGNEKTIKEMV